MDNWKNLKFDKFCIQKRFLAEYEVMELIKTPWAKFKVKIYESRNGILKGYTNLKVKDDNGIFVSGYGEGTTIEETLINTINNFLDFLYTREKWENDRFDEVELNDF